MVNSNSGGEILESNLRFREATPDDTGAIAAIYNESIRARDATMELELQSDEDFRRTLAGFNRRELILLLEEVDSATGGDAASEDLYRGIIGWGIIKRYSDRGGYRFACETAVYLRRDRLRLGHGTRIKNALIERCKELRYHHLVAKIFADNTASIEYNLRMGYEMVGIQRQIGFRRGRFQDIAILQLVLEDVPPEIPPHLLDDQDPET